MEFDHFVLSSLIWCPVLGAIIVALLPRRVAREGALAVALCNLLFAFHLPMHWGSGGDFQFTATGQELPGLPFSYHLGVDGISLPMVLLSVVLVPLVLLMAWNSVRDRAKEFFVLILLLEGAVIGVFCALDLILFYIFFEATLIPTYLLIVGWGGANRGRAGLKFFMYTMFGSILMLVAAIYIVAHGQAYGQSTTTFSYDSIRAAANNLENNPSATLFGWHAAPVLFGAFVLAFAVKSPLFPFHTWLPDAYAEAPTSATVLLAALLSKMGVYGFIRFAIPLFPQSAQAAAPYLMILAVVGIIYGALVAVAQTDIKRVLAYSSISHVGMILLGVFAVSSSDYGVTALSGATLQMVSHGLTTGALFLLAGVLFERRANLGTVPEGTAAASDDLGVSTVTNPTETREANVSREVRDFGGIAGVMPRYTVLFWFALFASIGLPGMCNFVGEYLILQGTMAANVVVAALAATTVIWGAVYMLKMFREAFFGGARPENAALPDVRFFGRESLALAILLAFALFIGIAPQGFLNVINPDAERIAQYMQTSVGTETAMLPEQSGR